MKKKVWVWQVGWEREVNAVEVEDDECAACIAVGQLPFDCDPIVMGMRVDGASEESVTHRHMEPALLGSMACRLATPEEVAEAFEQAQALAAGEIDGYVETDEERAERARFNDLISESMDLVIGGVLSISNNPAMRAIGNGLIAREMAQAMSDLGRGGSRVGEHRTGLAIYPSEPGVFQSPFQGPKRRK